MFIEMDRVEFCLVLSKDSSPSENLSQIISSAETFLSIVVPQSISGPESVIAYVFKSFEIS